MRTQLSDVFNFRGPDWAALRAYLTEERDRKVSLLLGKADLDETNRLRGAINLIDQLLREEQAAARKAAEERA